jgi:hypothetical protein
MLAWWLLSGIAAGWFLAKRLRVGTLCVFLVSSIVLPLLVFVVLHRFDLDAILGYAVFWAAVQAGYLICNISDCPSEHGDARPTDGIGNL